MRGKTRWEREGRLSDPQDLVRGGRGSRGSGGHGRVASAQLQSIYATCECGPNVNKFERDHHGKEHSPQIAALHAFEPRELVPSSQQFWALGFFTRVQAQTKKGAYAHVRWNHDAGFAAA
jgi:hypothetical protein